MSGQYGPMPGAVMYGVLHTRHCIGLPLQPVA